MTTDPRPPGDDNPYVGPFPIVAGKPFYGREIETRRLLNLLVAERIVLFYSPSGAGKTSLIEAGLVPRLEDKRFTVLPRIRLHHTATVGEPGDRHGNRYLDSTLFSLGCRVPAEQRRRLGHTTLDSYLNQLRAEQGSKYEVLIFDQFEEVLSIDPADPDAKRQFFEELGGALEDRSRWALFAMREDYLARLEPYMRQVPTDLAKRFRLDLLEGAYAKMAIRRPAADRHVEFTAPAADQLYLDLTQSRGPYVEPVQLQVVCRRLWERRASPDRIDVADISASGTVDDALMEFVDEQAQEVAAATGLRERELRDWMEGSLLTRQGHRQPTSEGPGQDKAAAARALRALTDSHFIREEPRPTGAWYELAHDRLIDPVLHSNERWRRGALSHLQTQAAAWLKHDRRSDYVLQGHALEDAEAWASAHEEELTDTERQYLEACRADRARALWRARRRRLAAALMATLLVLSVVTWIALLNAWRQERIAKAQTLVASGLRSLTVDPELSVLLGLQAAELSRRGQDTMSADARDLLYRAVAASRLRATLVLPSRQGPVPSPGIASTDPALAAPSRIGFGDVALSPDGTLVAGSSRDGQVAIWQVAKSRLLHDLPSRPGRVTRVAFDPGGTRIAFERRNGSLVVRDLRSDASAFVDLSDQVVDLAFSPDGDRLAVAFQQARAVVFQRSGRGWTPGASIARTARAVAISPDGRVLASGDQGGVIRLWDAASGRAMGTVEAHSNQITSVVFTAKGDRLASASLDGTAKIWKTSSLTRIYTLSGHTNAVLRVAFSGDGGRVATASLDGTARVWDVDTGRELLSLLGHAKAVSGAVFDRSGTTLITASWDGTVRTWNVASGHTGFVNSVAFSRDQRQVVTASTDTTARLWDSASGKQLVVYEGHASEVTRAVLSPDGRRVATASLDGTVRIWETSSGRLIWKRQHTSGQGLHSIAFDRDGGRLATVGDDGSAVVWSTVTHEPLHAPLTGHTGAVRDVAFSPDGTQLATTGDDQSVKVWDLSTWQLARSLRDDAGALRRVAYSPDGRKLATASSGGTTSIWDVAAARREHVLRDHDGTVSDVAFSLDGAMLATGSWDHTVRVWSVEGDRPEAPVVIEQPAEVNGVAFSPDSRFLATAGSDKAYRIFPVRDEDLLDRAEAHVTRSLTDEECRRYLGDNCPG